MLAIAIAGLLSGLVGAVLVLRAARTGRARMDVPDNRRLHDRATARGGGIGIIVAGAIALPFAQWWTPDSHDAYLLSVLILAWATPNGFIGLTDDYFPLGAKFKLSLQLAAACVAVALGLQINTLHLAPFPALELGFFAWPLSVLWLVWLTNVFNFMDGIDGIASACGAIFFAGLAVVGVCSGAIGLAMIAAGVGASLLGFLILNRPPARIFMGDGGALSVGAVLGGTAVLLTRSSGGVSIAIPLIILGPFVFDATYTLLSRLARRQPILEAHREHLYQRLVTAGWSGTRVLILYMGLAAASGLIALLFNRLSSLAQGLAWMSLAGCALGLIWLVRRAELRVTKATSPDEKDLNK